MKKTARIFSMFLVITLLFCFGGCKKEPSETARELINTGEYEKAYDLLLSIENPTEEEKALLSGFFFQELERINSSGGIMFRCTYDEKGRLISRHCTPDSYFGPTEKFTYDEKYNLLTWEITDQDGRWEKTVWTYDERGNVLTEDYSHYIYSNRKYTYTWDDKGNMLTSYEVIHDPTERWHSYVYTYDEKGNLVKEEYTYDGSFRKEHWATRISTHEYSGNIHTQTAHLYDLLGQHYRTVTYAYDEKNNLLTESSELGSTTYIYTYDDQGNITGQKCIGEHNNTNTAWEYDAEGRLSSKVRADLSSGEECYREQYTYDTYGNILTYYQKEYSEETSYSSTWKLFYDPVLAALSAEKRTPPEPVYSMKPQRFPA